MPSWAWWVVGAVAAAGLFVLLLPWIIQGIVRAILWPRYSFEVVGGEHLPRRGPVLLAVNHISWINGFVLAATVPRVGSKALVNSRYINIPVFRQLALPTGIIPVPERGPRAQRAAIEAVRAAFDRGDLVAIFPEAQISRNGLLGPFYRGLEVMLKGREDVAVVPVYLDNLWGSLFSYSGGRFFRKWPRGWRRRVVVAIGPPLETPITAFAVRQAVVAAAVQARERSPTGPPGRRPSTSTSPTWNTRPWACSPSRRPMSTSATSTRSARSQGRSVRLCQGLPSAPSAMTATHCPPTRSAASRPSCPDGTTGWASTSEVGSTATASSAWSRPPPGINKRFPIRLARVRICGVDVVSPFGANTQRESTPRQGDPRTTANCCCFPNGRFLPGFPIPTPS